MQNSLKPFQRLFHQQGLIHLAYKTITYIDTQTLLLLINLPQLQGQNLEVNQTEITAQQCKSQPKIKRMIQVHCFLKEYLNKTDRSMYFSFFDEPEFQSVSKQLYENIVIQESRSQLAQTKFSSQFQQLNHVFDQIQTQQLLSEQQLDQLKRIIVDPSLPLPPLKRQNQGMYCNSSFQLFLVGLRFPHYSQQDFTPFEDFKQKLEDQQDANFKQFLEIQKQKHSAMKVYENLHLVRYMPYEITFSNYKSLSLQNNSMHNFIVVIFALTDVWIQSILSIINLIDDPFYKLVQLISRYSTFRSLVMQLQNLYADTIRDSLFQASNIKPKYCFWRPALTKWFLKMNNIHSQTNQVYFMLLTKLRQEALLDRIDVENHDPAWKPVRKHFITLKNSFELNQFSAEMKDKIYQNMTGSSLIEQFISENQQTCQALIFQYVQYFTDLAINEQTVHWCGHSRHHLQEPFTLFNKEFCLYNDSFVANLKEKVLADIVEKDRKKITLQLFIQSDLEFLENKNVKPVMLRQYVEDINVKRKFFENFIEDENSSQKFSFDKISNETISVVESLKENRNDIIFANFTEKDQTLKYFNEKAMICESIEGEEKCFFSIPPLLSPEEILTKSINTNDTSQNQECDNNSSFEYVSDDECQIEEAKNKENTENGEKKKDKPQEKILFKTHKVKQAKQKVKFSKYLQDIDPSEEISSEKKTLHSTNSSVKDSQTLNTSEQNQKSRIQQEEILITKSQSV